MISEDDGSLFKFVRRLCLILKVIMGNLASTNTLLLTLFLGIDFGQNLVGFFIGLVPSRYYEVLPSMNKNLFVSTTVYATLLVCCISLLLSVKYFIAGVLRVRARKVLTKHMHRVYFQKNTFLPINMEFCFYNHDQAMTQDVDKFTKDISTLASKTITTPFLLVFYTYNCAKDFGLLGTFGIYVFIFFFAILSHFTVNPVVSNVRRLERHEGELRKKHFRVIKHCEEIALLSGEDYELNKSNEFFFRVICIMYKILFINTGLNLLSNVCSYMGAILSYLILGFYSFSNNKALTASDISASSFYTLSLIYTLTQMISLYEIYGAIAGYTHRIGMLIEYFQTMKPDKQCNRNTSRDKLSSSFEEHLSYNAVCDETFIIVENLSVCIPNIEVILISGINLTLLRNVNLGISGPTGVGKSSLLKTICGTWPSVEGTITISERVSNHIIFLPQSPYFTTGSLYDQVSYPDIVDNEDEICQVLTAVGLSHLISRKVEDWNQSLSPGEKQRIGFARLIFKKPLVAVIDEGTSSLSDEIAEFMYQLCIDRQITLVSVSHNLRILQKFHDHILIIHDKNTIELKKATEI